MIGPGDDPRPRQAPASMRELLGSIGEALAIGLVNGRDRQARADGRIEITMKSGRMVPVRFVLRMDTVPGTSAGSLPGPDGADRAEPGP